MMGSLRGAAAARCRPGGFAATMLLAGMATGLLGLAGAALLAAPPVGADSAPPCVAFQVGSPHPAETRLRLQNAGPAPLRVRLDFVDHDGRYPQPVGWNPVLEPGASGDFAFRAPALGAAVKLVASGAGLRAEAAILRDDGAPAELRAPVGCRAESVPP